MAKQAKDKSTTADKKSLAEKEKQKQKALETQLIGKTDIKVGAIKDPEKSTASEIKSASPETSDTDYDLGKQVGATKEEKTLAGTVIEKKFENGKEVSILDTRGVIQSKTITNSANELVKEYAYKNGKPVKEDDGIDLGNGQRATKDSNGWHVTGGVGEDELERINYERDEKKKATVGHWEDKLSDAKKDKKAAVDEQGRKSADKAIKDAKENIADLKKKEKDKSKDPCSDAGETLGSNFACKKTYGTIKQAEVANTVSQAAGQALISSIGQRANESAAQSGIMSETHREASKLHGKTAMIQGALGAVNTYYALRTGKQAKRHKQNANQLAEEGDFAQSMKESGYGMYQVDATGQRVNSLGGEYRQSVIDKKELNDKFGHIKNPKEKLAAVTAYTEAKMKSYERQQKDARNEATIAKAENKKEAIKQFMGMGASIFAAKQAKQTADLAQKVQDKENNPLRYNYHNDQDMLRQQMENAAAVTGDKDGTGGDKSASGDTNTTDLANNTNGTYEDGMGDPAAPAGGPTGPGPAFIPAQGGPGGLPSAGGVGGGGGGSAPEAPNQNAGEAQYAANFEGKDKYEGSGTLTKGVGGGNRGTGGGGDEGGFDPSSFLAKFFPSDKPEESPVTEAQFSGNRGIAAVESAPSFLDASADLFGRVHDRLQEFHGKGRVGDK